MLKVRVAGAGAQGVALDAGPLGALQAPPAAGAASGMQGWLVVRPEQVRIGAQREAGVPNQFRGRVRDLLYAGNVTTYLVELAGGALVRALLPNTAAGRARFFEAGDEVFVGWDADAGAFLHE
jgi:spermidine/putrescine transport system ATP-binding protein